VSARGGTGSPGRARRGGSSRTGMEPARQRRRGVWGYWRRFPMVRAFRRTGRLTRGWPPACAGRHGRPPRTRALPGKRGSWKRLRAADASG